MFPKTSPTSADTPKNEPHKEEKTPPKRSFREVMATRHVSQPPQRRSNVFELASKNSTKPKQQEKKKESDHAAQGHSQVNQGAQQANLQSLESIMEVKSLSLEMQALLDKMADYVKLESDNGIQVTTVSIEMGDESSLFNGSEIRIDHYDTAPHSFNIQLSGNPEAVDTFTQHLASLQTALTERLEHFHIELLPPIIGEKMDAFETRKKERKKHMRLEKVEKR